MYMDVFFCCNDTATTEIYTYLHTLALHDALPICGRRRLHAAVALSLHALGDCADECRGASRHPLFPSVGDRPRPAAGRGRAAQVEDTALQRLVGHGWQAEAVAGRFRMDPRRRPAARAAAADRKSTRLNSSH